ncbi:MAG: AgmX/PglI C-terminal domain-containing protein [Myxococcales bacterium]|nr:AgmX/PglI C-terminal domain-containing protein [Myxococcales bacterium]
MTSVVDAARAVRVATVVRLAFVALVVASLVGCAPRAPASVGPSRTNEGGATPRKHGRIEPVVIQRVARASFGSFTRCYEAGLARDPKLQGRVSTKFVIELDGSVSQAAVGAATTLPDKAVVSCVVEVFGRLRFPRPEGGIVDVVYPLSFSPEVDEGEPMFP